MEYKNNRSVLNCLFSVLTTDISFSLFAKNRRIVSPVRLDQSFSMAYRLIAGKLVKFSFHDCFKLIAGSAQMENEMVSAT